MRKFKDVVWSSEDEMIQEIEAYGYDVLNITECEIDVIDTEKSDDVTETYTLNRTKEGISIDVY